MPLLSDIEVERPSSRSSIVTVKLRTPELAKALHGSGHGFHLVAWLVATTALAWFAWKGGLGLTAHAVVKFSILAAALFWVTHSVNRVWQNHNRARIDRVVVTLDNRSVSIRSAERNNKIIQSRDELRFSSRPDRRGRDEERDERRVGHPVGFEHRDAWEIWCEAGVHVEVVAIVHDEDDARAIVRHLTEESLFVTRGDDVNEFAPARGEPA